MDLDGSYATNASRGSYASMIYWQSQGTSGNWIYNDKLIDNVLARDKGHYCVRSWL
jgi:hypothetical protein